MQMIEESGLSLRKQCELLGLNRSSIYYKKEDKDSEVAEKIVGIYVNSGCRYGYRKIHEELRNEGYKVNHKKVLSIMNEQKIKGINPKKKFKYYKTEHKKYPYLLAFNYPQIK